MVRDNHQGLARDTQDAPDQARPKIPVKLGNRRLKSDVTVQGESL